MEEFSNCCDVQNNSKYKHERTIIHIDLDCFYAQVEMLKNPELSTKPIGIKQQHYLITSNYVAREFGIRKCMPITEALALCPKLIIINGEDLHDYRLMSSKVTDIIRQFSVKVEKLGFDENFIDVTDIVSKRVSSFSEILEKNIKGHVYMNFIENICTCGCKERLILGSQIASDIRERIKEESGMTCCAGIAHNKLLAKLVCPTHKPNQQTTVFPCSAINLVSNLSSMRAIPGIGRKTSDVLDALGISKLHEAQNVPLKLLEKHFGKTLALWIKGACFGIDDSDVKVSGKQQVIGLEEAFKKIATIEEVEKKFISLIERGMVLLKEDGRYPTTLRVSVRKYSEEYTRQRETKQCPINPSVFRTDSVKEHILESALNLFKTLVNYRQPFHLTLIGLAFTKFQEEMPARSSLLQFMKPQSNLNTLLISDKEKYKNKLKYNEINSETFPTTQTENALDKDSALEALDKSVLQELPEDIRTEILQSYSQPLSIPGPSALSNNKNKVKCPPGVDCNTFYELPEDIQMELLRESMTHNIKDTSVKKSLTPKKQKTILNFFKT